MANNLDTMRSYLHNRLAQMPQRYQGHILHAANLLMQKTASRAHPNGIGLDAALFLVWYAGTHANELAPNDTG